MPPESEKDHAASSASSASSAGDAEEWMEEEREEHQDEEESDLEQSLLVKATEKLVLGVTWPGFALCTWLTRILVRERQGKRKAEKVYARVMDGYILVNFLAVFVAVFFLQESPQFFRFVALPFLVWRIAEIVALGMRFALFESARQARTFWASGAHIVVIGLINYIEMALCFAGIYAGWIYLIEDSVRDFWTPFHLSFATQMTIGYGDAVPTGWLRGVAHTQAFCGFILLSVLVGRYMDTVGNRRRSETEEEE